MKSRLKVILGGLCLSLGAAAQAAAPNVGSAAHGVSSASPDASTAPSAAGVEFFEKRIRPVLAERCYACHSARAPELKGGLLLDSRQGVLRGGKDGPVLVLGDPAKSRLIDAIHYTDPDLQMPPKKPLSAEQVAAFEAWIRMGAPDPRDATAPLPPPGPYDYSAERKFWSFQPVRDRQPPQVADSTGLLSPIDRFLEADYESLHLHPAPPADRLTLIRRVTYDLTGLPPTPAEIDAFLADSSSDAYEKLVDRLLASPHYGEQWGRHWLDVVRYADTSGCNADFPVPQAYKYRNYVIDSFNRDKPYDQFLREQLAGDLLPHKTEAEKRDQIVATGYLAISRRFGSSASEFYLTIQDTLDNMGKSMLGLSIGCARCHDHKFDPIPTSDYYALYGIFASTNYAFPGTETLPHPTGMVPLGSDDDARRLHEYEQDVTKHYADIRRWGLEILRLSSLVKANRHPTTQPSDPSQMLAQVKAGLAVAKAEQRKLDEEGPPDVPTAYAVTDGPGKDAHIQHKGTPTDPGPKVHRGFLQILGGQTVPRSEKGSGRLELARWITDPANPLTARVMVNRIWEYHFGKGIVSTPNDFGHRGQPPTDPALLDYLAARFIQSGWSVKAMQRMILLSRAYQMSDAYSPADAAIDPDNAHLWRFNARRLSAEEIRDSILADAGELDPVVDAGPHPFPPESSWHYSQHRPFVADYPTKRRSIYMMQQRIRKQPFLAVFDGADTNDTTPDRPLSTTAVQALYMMNDPFVHREAERLVARVATAGPEDARRINLAYTLLFARPATADEIRIGRQYLEQAGAELTAAGVSQSEQPDQAWAGYLQVLLSSNEFIWLD